MNKKLLLLLIPALLLGCSESCATKSSEVLQNANCEPKCLDSMPEFDAGQCQLKCQKHLSIARPDQTAKLERVCEQMCQSKAQRIAQQHTLLCQYQCSEDPDKDGVVTSNDKCPKSKEGIQVNRQGCADEDGDGVADADDRCPKTGGDVGPDGCLLKGRDCSLGHCAAEKPPKCVNETCPVDVELPVPQKLSDERRRALARKLLSLRPAYQSCPGAKGIVPTPQLISPPYGLSAQQDDRARNGMAGVGVIALGESDGKLHALKDDDTATVETRGSAPNQVIPINVKFSSVQAACPPVSYSLYVKYYYCDEIPGVESKHHYQELGFCKWLPLDYVSGVQADTEFIYPFKMGELFAKLYTPHYKKIPGFALERAGKKFVLYRKLWLNFQVIAHDGNGATSSFGLHTDSAYRVIYGWLSRAELTKIPSSAHQH